MATSCSYYFQETLRATERSGIDPRDLLRQIGLTPEDIADPSWRGPSEKLAELVQLVWFLLDDEFMGFTEHRCKPGVFAMMANIALHEQNIEAVIRKGVLFYRLFTDDLTMEYRKTGTVSLLEIEFPRRDLDPNNYFLEFWLSIWYRFLCWMSGKILPLKAVEFAYPEPLNRAEELRLMFPGQQYFSQGQTRLVFAGDLATIDNVRNRSELKAMLNRAPLAFMVVPTSEATLARRIRSDILAARGTQIIFPQLEQLADLYGMSQQTLRRRLQEEGTSFRRVIESLRRDLAVQNLLRTKKSIAEISEGLGYSETRAFTRAFHQWTGMSPRSYRNSFLDQIRGSDGKSELHHRARLQP